MNLEVSQQNLKIYEGFNDDDEHVRDLARTFTQASADLTYNDKEDANNDSSYKNNNTDTAIGLKRMLSHMSEVPGVNPLSDHEIERLNPDSDLFEAKFWVKNLKKLYESDPDYYKPSSLGVAYRDLRAYGLANDIDYQATVTNVLWKLATQSYRWIRKEKESDYFNILKPMDGIMRPGELTVVLGRPGSGCSTLLKSVAVNTYGFHLGRESQITYDGLTQQQIRKNFRGDVIYSAETDVHFPHLTVGDTLEFAARFRTPHNRGINVTREAYAKHLASAYMAMYGLSHTKYTYVGNEVVRGVSGGERKRVSIAEVSLSGANIQCWDNATRGLDAATALEFIRALKTSAMVLDTTPLIAIYQCSQDAYELFDKTVVLYEGYQIYFGRADKAKKYFINMGYECPERQTTADFLTSITNPAERIVRPGFEHKVPRLPREFDKYWKKSPEHQTLIQEIDDYLATCETRNAKGQYQQSHVAKQAKHMNTASPYTVSFPMQVKYITKRNWLRMKGDPSIPVFSVLGQFFMGLVLSSVFYNLSQTTESFYFRGAGMFFAVLYNAFASLLEIMALFEARPIVEKHKKYALYRPSADALASIITEFPVKLAMSISFNLVFYFMVNFRREPGRFFFYWLMCIWCTLVMSHLFRSIGAVSTSLAGAMTPAIVLLLALVIYTGFVIPTTTMLGWSRWINYINPVGYVFESLMVNEFHNREFECATFIPMGPGYENVSDANRVCTTVGSRSGSNIVNGTDYVAGLYGYFNSHKWRNLGITIGFAVFFLVIYIFLTEFNKGAMQKGEILLFLRGKLGKHKLLKRAKGNGNFINNDYGREVKEEEVGENAYEKVNFESAVEAERSNKIGRGEGGGGRGQAKEEEKDDNDEEEKEHGKKEKSRRMPDSLASQANLSFDKDIFMWRNLTYQVKIKKEDRIILNRVDGWVKPGQITALIGATGAGKTTLLNCLSERLTTGVITDGIRMVNGHSLDSSFQRSIGYAQQQDLHLAASTVREALQFSAYLRQSSNISKREKDEYVDYVINLLEMNNYADAMVGVAGEGLNVEQRKRLTIGVELVAKPKLLLFLDEPTSGLDSQTAWSICKLLRKLADHGQAILCTIHQPSAILMKEFDRLLFLQQGGQTVYFGNLGFNCSTLIDYFESQGADPCPPSANPAEWMLHVVGAAPGSHAKQDYFEVWRNSKEYQAVQAELDKMQTELSKLPRDGDPETRLKYAALWWSQYLLVSKRVIVQNWRTPVYIWSKLFLVIAAALFNGFSFFKAGTSLQGLQNQMFSVFMSFIPFNTLIQQMLPYFAVHRDVYETRESPSRMFSWFAFIAGQITSELPFQVILGTLAYFCWYYPVGLYANAIATDSVAERGTLVWLYLVAFYVWCSTIGQMCMSFLEHQINAGNLASLLFMFCLLFCGVLATKLDLPGFWIFMYYCNPLTYLIQGILVSSLANTNVVCNANEMVPVVPPQGMSCNQFLGPFIQRVGGYVESVDGVCYFCLMGSTNVFLHSLNAEYSERWRNWGIVIAFIVINMFITAALYWLVRVPKRNREQKVKVV
ncbi:multidrug resistance protein CDR1 [Lodderomyces elongisporus NRRL YB-4239]|uniref:Multidrug resistance protein CDR1 n=1 Tax=Lodderomyces elongisporus (strain ATCC 11503 / CBS 2605 / JCM 1781 / NBRC 1676 / NRRL YB-4239) TaxID=379508 RepID=A5DZT9_LODEL|nr:multidrug resistance protein CDR1 [Lodderomyces elongisporus NRRL YB-4239]